MCNGYNRTVYNHLNNIMDTFDSLRNSTYVMDHLACLFNDKVPSEYFNFKEELMQFLPKVYDMFQFLPKASQLLIEEKTSIRRDLEEDEIYNYLTNIISYVAGICMEISIIESFIILDKESIPDVFFEFKRKFVQFLSSTELFSLSYEHNASLMNKIVNTFYEDIEWQEEALEEDKQAIEHKKYCVAFFENFINFSSMMKCDTTLQSSTDLSPSKNA